MRNVGLVVAALVFVLPARADFLISFDANTDIAPGSTGYVNVYISSTNVLPQPLQNTAFEFRITTAGATRLEFMNSPAPASDPALSNTNYVFVGDSYSLINNEPVGAASTTTVPNDTFIGGDLTNSGSNVSVGTTARLLAMLPVTAATALPPTLGNTFTISLIPSSGSGFVGNTGFGDASLNFADFISGTGNVTIAAVPEPGTLVLVGLGVGVSFLGGWRRAQRARARPAALNGSV